MTHIKCSLDHGIIFLLDYEKEDIEIPEYDKTNPVSSNQFCISVAAQPAVDGEVVICLNENIQNSTNKKITLNLVFEGILEIPSKKFSVTNSYDEVLLDEQFNTDQVFIKIFIDDPDFAEHIEIQVTEIK